jgi:hypothetical protein
MTIARQRLGYKHATNNTGVVFSIVRAVRCYAARTKQAVMKDGIFCVVRAEGIQETWKIRNRLTVIKIWSKAPDGCFIPRQTGRLIVGLT